MHTNQTVRAVCGCIGQSPNDWAKLLSGIIPGPWHDDSAPRLAAILFDTTDENLNILKACIEAEISHRRTTQHD